MSALAYAAMVVAEQPPVFYHLKPILKRATRDELTSPDWAVNFHFTDAVRKYLNNHSCSAALELILRKLRRGRSNRVNWLTLILLETCMKNCGETFHRAAAHDALFRVLLHLAKRRIKAASKGKEGRPSNNLHRDLAEEQALRLIQAWGMVFKDAKDRRAIYRYYYNKLLRMGVQFPEVKPEDLDMTPRSPRPAAASLSARSHQDASSSTPSSSTASSKKASRTAAFPASSKGKTTVVVPEAMKTQLSETKESMNLLSEMLDALDEATKPSQVDLIVSLVSNLRAAKPKLAQMIEQTVDQNPKLVEALMALYERLDNLLGEYDLRNGAKKETPVPTLKVVDKKSTKKKKDLSPYASSDSDSDTDFEFDGEKHLDQLSETSTPAYHAPMQAQNFYPAASTTFQQPFSTSSSPAFATQPSSSFTTTSSFNPFATDSYVPLSSSFGTSASNTTTVGTTTTPYLSPPTLSSMASDAYNPFLASPSPPSPFSPSFAYTPPQVSTSSTTTGMSHNNNPFVSSPPQPIYNNNGATAQAGGSALDLDLDFLAAVSTSPVSGSRDSRPSSSPQQDPFLDWLLTAKPNNTSNNNNQPAARDRPRIAGQIPTLKPPVAANSHRERRRSQGFSG